jgi:hypothetical protein
MAKTQFAHGTPVGPEHANGWQDPQFVSRADYPDGFEQMDLPNGQLFVPSVHIKKDLVGFSGENKKFLNGEGNIVSPWGGEVTDKPSGYAHTPPFHTVDVAAGCIIDTNSVKRCWVDQPVQCTDGQVSYVYVDDLGAINVDDILPSRVVPHTPLAAVSASGDLTTIEDLRPHVYAGAHNDTPLQLVNTNVATGDYEANSWDRVPVDTSGGSLTILLPENPRDGDRVAMLDVGGALNVFPAVIGAKKQVIGEIATPVHSINQESKDWIFNTPYSYIVLVYVENEGSWFFEEMPDGNCDPAPGSFIGCGGPHPMIDSPEACVAPFNWNTNLQKCMIPQLFGVYASKNPGEIFYTEYDNNCRCAYRLDAGVKCFDRRGTFKRCEGGHGYYDRGDGNEVINFQDPRCDGSSRGGFLRCVGNTGEYQAVNHSPTQDPVKVPRDPRCMDSESSHYAKRGFVEDHMQLGIDFRRITIGDEDGAVNEEVVEFDNSGFVDEIVGGFGSAGTNNRSQQKFIIGNTGAPNVANAAWVRIRTIARCDGAPCNSATIVNMNYSVEGEISTVRVAETRTFLPVEVPNGIAPVASNITWLPLNDNWRSFILKVVKSGPNDTNDLNRAELLFFTNSERVLARHYVDY